MKIQEIVKEVNGIKFYLVENHNRNEFTGKYKIIYHDDFNCRYNVLFRTNNKKNFTNKNIKFYMKLDNYFM